MNSGVNNHEHLKNQLHSLSIQGIGTTCTEQLPASHVATKVHTHTHTPTHTPLAAVPDIPSIRLKNKS
jgi:hypothetical protein